MRSHGVRPLGCVAVVLIVFRDQALEEVTHIEHHVRICILLNHERAGGVLDKNRKHSIGDVLPGEPILDILSERIEPLAARGNRQGRVANHALYAAMSPTSSPSSIDAPMAR